MGRQTRWADDVVNGMNLDGCWCQDCRQYREVHMEPEMFRQGLQRWRWLVHVSWVQEKIERERQEAAEQRARMLLEEHLDPKQVKSYREHCYFDEVVEGKEDSGYFPSRKKRQTFKYRIGGYNVRELAPEQINWCIVAQVGIPDPDLHLTQLLWLRYNHEEFRSLAIGARLYR